MILVVDDDVAIQASLKFLLNGEGYKVAVAGKQGEALRALKSSKITLVILDMNFSLDTSGRDGIELLTDIVEQWPNIPVILITGWASVELAVEGMRIGAFDFIAKPWKNSKLLESVDNGLRLTSTTRESRDRGELDRDFNFSNIVGSSSKLVALLEKVSNVATTTASVLIEGESGTGKELIAHALHNNSNRSSKPFVSVNMGAIPPTLFESEMFGYCKGAFTDARGDKRGKFELSCGGTLFLDEIGDIDINSQTKLLRVLQEQSVDKIGSVKPIAIDVRVVCATNKNLKQMIADGLFREDLYYRINLINLDIPPLRDRREDIPELIDSFVKSSSNLYGRDISLVTVGAIELLKEMEFTGNVRELKNYIERAVIYAKDGEITEKLIQSLVTDVASPYVTVDSNDIVLPKVGTLTIEEMEIAMISQALSEYSYNISRASEALGMTRQALYRRMKKFEL